MQCPRNVPQEIYASQERETPRFVLGPAVPRLRNDARRLRRLDLAMTRTPISLALKAREIEPLGHPCRYSLN